MLADVGQTVAVGIIVVGAAVYLGITIYRAVTGRHGCTGCGPAGRAPSEPTSSSTRPFVSSDQFTDMARRHREHREAGKPST